MAAEETGMVEAAEEEWEEMGMVEGRGVEVVVAEALAKVALAGVMVATQSLVDRPAGAGWGSHFNNISVMLCDHHIRDTGW